MGEITVKTKDANYTLDARVGWDRIQQIFPQEIRRALMDQARPLITKVDLNELAKESLTDAEFQIFVRITRRETSDPGDFKDQFQALMFFAHLQALSTNGELDLTGVL